MSLSTSVSICIRETSSHKSHTDASDEPEQLNMLFSNCSSQTYGRTINHVTTSRKVMLSGSQLTNSQHIVGLYIIMSSYRLH